MYNTFNIVNALPGLVIAGIVVFFVILAFYWEHSRSVSMIERWATENGLQLVSSSRRYFQLGTPFWAASKGHTIYRITVQDANYHMMSGYALCGGFFLGLWSDRVEVKWDDETVVKFKNDDFEKPKNDFVKRKNEW